LAVSDAADVMSVRRGLPMKRICGRSAPGEAASPDQSLTAKGRSYVEIALSSDGIGE
jgi:hypothetical protein